MTKDIIKTLTNSKTRTLLLFTGGILLTGVTIAILNINGADDKFKNRESKVSGVPSNVESTPGSKTTAKYQELTQTANLVGTQQAAAKGETFVPTITGNKNKNNLSFQDQFENALSDVNIDAQKRKLAEARDQNPQLDALFQQQQEAEQRRLELQRQRQAELEAERLRALNEARLKVIESTASAMESQAKASFDAWTKIPTQAYVSGEWANLDNADINGAGSRQSGAADDDLGPVILKAGTILLGSLDTSVNSDEPSPVMARVVQGQFKGARLIGTMEAQKSQQAKKLVLRFNTISIEDQEKSLKIDAVAIDPDTARTALASDVDHHYIFRYGSLFASAFLEGYSKAVAESGTSVSTQTTAGTTTTTTNKAALDGKQQVFEGLGKVGETFGSRLGKNFERYPTITIDAGTGIGILLLSDVQLGDFAKKPNAQKSEEKQTQAALPNTTDPLGLLTSVLSRANPSAVEGN